MASDSRRLQRPDWAYTLEFLWLRLREELVRSERLGTALAVLVVRWSDDKAPRLEALEAARTLSRSVRLYDIAVESGPNEVAVCLLDVSRDGPNSVASRFNETLAREDLSIGIAISSLDGRDAEHLLSCARQRTRPN